VVAASSCEAGRHEEGTKVESPAAKSRRGAHHLLMVAQQRWADIRGVGLVACASCQSGSTR
jgi:hypothetical protein